MVNCFNYMIHYHCQMVHKLCCLQLVAVCFCIVHVKHAALLIIHFYICLEPYVNRCTAHKHCSLLYVTSSDGLGKQGKVSVSLPDYFLFPYGLEVHSDFSR
jgi:hypothetical protein